MKFSVPSGYVYFATVVLLVTALTSFVSFTCPVDGGTGVIAGLKGVDITDIEGELINFETYETPCAEIYSAFTYAVKISLVNKTTTPANGALVVKFYDTEAKSGNLEVALTKRAMVGAAELPGGEMELTLEEVSEGGMVSTFIRPPEAQRLFFVSVSPESVKTVEKTISFGGFGFQAITHTLSATAAEQTVCPYSNGTGKVPLTEWLRLKAGV